MSNDNNESEFTDEIWAKIADEFNAAGPYETSDDVMNR